MYSPVMADLPPNAQTAQLVQHIISVLGVFV
jgi:hypothetical protein